MTADAPGSKPEVESPPPSPDGLQRVLIIAAESLVGEELFDHMREHVGNGELRAFVVAPAITDSPLKHAMGDVDVAIEEASWRLEESLERLRERGVAVEGRLGDSDPIIAIEDSLALFPADQIFVVTHPADDGGWLEDDLFDRAKQKFEPPITHIEIKRRGADESTIVDEEESGRGIEDAPDAEVPPRSRNMPRLSVRDLAGIAVAIAGTIILVVLAASCEGETVQRNAGTAGTGSDGGCVARYVIAGAAALVNIAHVVGLVLFESLGYRGGWERVFAMLSLYGTPAAIVLSLLVH